MCADRANGLAHGLAFVAAEIVHDDDIAGLQRRYQDLLDIGQELLAVDRSVEDAWRLDPIAAQAGQEGLCPPPAVGRPADQAPATARPAAQRRHIRLGPGFIDEDKPAGINPRLVLLPLPASPGDVRTILFAGERGFF